MTSEGGGVLFQQGMESTGSNDKTTRMVGVEKVEQIVTPGNQGVNRVINKGHCTMLKLVKVVA